MRSSIAIRVAMMALTSLLLGNVSFAQISVGVSIRIGPPALPAYVQPACPTEGYLWTPGYWAYGPDGYYWVPGVWVAPPRVGVLWTPGYWGWNSGVYVFHGGYWGPHVGFYGGVNYGFGYGGVGFVGGGWEGGRYRYNTAVTNVNTTVIHNTYVNKTVINNTTVNRTSFNGGPGGVSARPTASEQVAAREPHVQPTAAQVSHEHTAGSNRDMLASNNHGKPATAAMSTVGHSANPVNKGNRPAPAAASAVHNNAGRSDRPPTAGKTVNSSGAQPNAQVSHTAGNPNHPPTTTSSNASKSNVAPKVNSNRPPTNTLSKPPAQLKGNTNHPQNTHPAENHPHGEAKEKRPTR